MAMVILEQEGTEKPLKRIPAFAEPDKKELYNFVTQSTRRFFSLLDFSTIF